MKLRFIFLTLTVKNPRLIDLKATIQDMQKAFNRMTKTVQWKRSILGYCRVFEITKPKCGKEKDNIHPHFHVLLAVKTSYFSGKSSTYLKKDDYADMWQKALRVDYKPVCDVRIITGKTKDGKVIKDSTAAICELIKYPLKDSDLSKFTWQEFKILDEQMTRVRAINYGGILKDGNKTNIIDIKIDKEALDMWREIEKVIMEYHKDLRRLVIKHSKLTSALENKT